MPISEFKVRNQSETSGALTSAAGFSLVAS